MPDAPEREYTVSWSVFTDATTPFEAVEIAKGMLDDPHNTATLFVVEDHKTGDRTIVETEHDEFEVVGGDKDTEVGK